MDNKAEKIRKLLMLATRGEGPEAKQARRRADKMLKARGWTEADVLDIEKVFINRPEIDVENDWRQGLLVVVAEYCDATIVETPRGIGISGPRPMIERVTYLYDTLHAQIRHKSRDFGFKIQMRVPLHLRTLYHKYEGGFANCAVLGLMERMVEGAQPKEGEEEEEEFEDDRISPQVFEEGGETSEVPEWASVEEYADELDDYFDIHFEDDEMEFVRQGYEFGLAVPIHLALPGPKLTEAEVRAWRLIGMKAM